MNRIPFFFQKLLALLRIRPIVGGLDISDQVLRSVYFNGKSWEMHAVRLERGILEDGHIKDRPRLLASLTALKTSSAVGGRNKNKKVSVVVSLSSVGVYSQVFSLPSLGSEELTRAVELNVRMAAPEDASKIYSSWQIVGKDEASLNLEVLSSFIDKAVVDDMVEALFEAGFLAMAIEPRVLALTRILREKGSGIDIKKPYLLVSVDNAGVEFIVIRNGAPYFEYNNRWSEVANEKGEVTVAKFEAELTASLHQVLNFYSQHWTEAVNAIIISAVAFHDEIEKTIATAGALPTVRLTLEMGQPISSEWLVALGCDLRGLNEKIGEVDINLLGEEWRDQFQEEQMGRFLQFWQVLVPIVFGILVAVFVVADIFLVNTKTSLEAAASFATGAANAGSIGALQASSTAFNNEVAMLSTLESSGGKMSAAFQDITAKAAASGITISHVSFSGPGEGVTLSGSASSEDRVLAFKDALSGDPQISDVNLPITGVQSNGGIYSFSMTFVSNP